MLLILYSSDSLLFGIRCNEKILHYNVIIVDKFKNTITMSQTTFLQG